MEWGGRQVDVNILGALHGGYSGTFYCPLATWFEEPTHWKRPWCWERLKAGGEGDDRGWDGWMASPTWWTWVWLNSGSWWWTGRPGVLQSMGSQRVRHTEWLNWTELYLLGSYSHGIFQARLLEWVAISFSRLSSQPRDWTLHLLHCRWRGDLSLFGISLLFHVQF